MATEYFETRQPQIGDTPIVPVGNAPAGHEYTSVFLDDLEDLPLLAPGSGDWVQDGEYGGVILNRNVFIDTTGAHTIRLQFLGNQYTYGNGLASVGEEWINLMDGEGADAMPSNSLSFQYIDESGNVISSSPSGVIPVIGGNDNLLEFIYSGSNNPNLWVETQPNISVTGFTATSGIWLRVSTVWDDTHGDPEDENLYEERHDLGYMVLRYDANGDIMDYVPPSGSVGTGSSPGGSGDPYIHSLAGSIYKLPDMPGNCRFLSTKQGVEDRFLVDISVEKLRFEEQKALLQELLTYDRDILEKYKLPLDGYYFRNFYISNQNSYIVVNLENGTIKTTDSEKSIKSLYENGGILDYQSFNIEIIKSQLADRKTVANYDLVEMDYTVRIKTHNKIYGNIAVELYSLLNKQIRNSIKITAQYPITLNNSRGAYLMPQHTDNMYVKELGSKKKIKDATNYKENEYKTLTETYYKTNPIEKYTRTLLIQQ